MTTHNLTSEQMKKFFFGVGASPCQPVTGGQFSTEELQKLAESNGGLQDWTRITDDPRVNYAVDCVNCAINDEDEDVTYDENLYADEIEAWREAYGDGAFDN